eukprot:evm.model.scf_300.1 EVM.evm.TU.scf_300.1   scf_300:17135-18201(-)
MGGTVVDKAQDEDDKKAQRKASRDGFWTRVGWSLLGLSMGSFIFATGFQVAEGFDDQHTQHLVRTGAVFLSCLLFGIIWSFVWNPPGEDAKDKGEDDAKREVQ